MTTKKNKPNKYNLVVKNLNVNYKVTKGTVKAVNNVSFQIKAGEALGIVGESGCGKTTIALSLIRLLPNNISKLNGTITLGNKKINNLSDDIFRKTVKWKQISMVFQGAMNSLNPVLRIGDQIIEPLVNTVNLNQLQRNPLLNYLILLVYQKTFIPNIHTNLAVV